jgi:hypothetical protein
MRITTAALALGTALALSSAATVTVARAQNGDVVRRHRPRVIITAPVEPAPYWDSNIVPRYRYRPEDDRVDPYGPPVVPVVRYNGSWLGG